MPNTTPSNSTGLRYAEETIGTPGTLPGSPVFYPLEPNSYGEFGGQVKSVARNPINAGRQRRKGVVVDVDASAGFNTDFAQHTLYDLMQGFMFASWREKTNEAPSSVSATGYVVADETLYAANDLIFAESFSAAANNGLKLVTSVDGASSEVRASGLAVDAAPASDAKITKVGVQAGAADLTLTVTSGVATLGSTVLDFTDLGLIPGEWVWIGGDTSATQFATEVNNGFYRIETVAANSIVFDRAPNSVATDAGTGKTIRLFYGHVIKNEAEEASQVKRTYTLERSLAGKGWEYLQGAMPNTLALDIKTADKIVMDLAFVAMDSYTRVQGDGAVSGTRPDLPASSYAFNASSDFTRLRLLDDTAGDSLATYLQDLKLTIDNGVTPAKAVGTIGAIDLVPGDFMVSGQVEAFFSTVTAVDAVRDNADVALDFALVAQNVGWLFDIPLITLGDARLTVEKDKPIILPLSMEAAAHETLDHTLLVVFYPYLPSAAQ